MNAALGTKLGQEEYDERVRIVRETAALVRAPSAERTAPCDLATNPPLTTESAPARGREGSGTAPFRPINSNLRRRDGPTASTCPTKRQRRDQDGAGGFCHGNSNGVLAAHEASSLRLLADVAGWEHEELHSTGVVPTLRPAEQISGTPVPDHDDNLLGITSTTYEPLRLGHDVAAASPRDSLPAESDVRNLSPRDVEDAASPQPSVSSYSNPSGLVTLPDGSCLPIRYLKGQAAGIAGMAIDTDALGTPSGISLGTIVSPECRDLMAPTESPRQSHMLSEAAGQAEMQDQEKSLREVDLLMSEFVDFT